ncbi:hypothetical protein FGB62_34g012 [Gracilaria domingensis]|nr:hypothetical protein FGB62_34g012 [Gracilaria domingensis]
MRRHDGGGRRRTGLVQNLGRGKTDGTCDGGHGGVEGCADDLGGETPQRVAELIVARAVHGTSYDELGKTNGWPYILGRGYVGNVSHKSIDGARGRVLFDESIAANDGKKLLDGVDDAAGVVPVLYMQLTSINVGEGLGGRHGVRGRHDAAAG